MSLEEICILYYIRYTVHTISLNKCTSEIHSSVRCTINEIDLDVFKYEQWNTIIHLIAIINSSQSISLYNFDPIFKLNFSCNLNLFQWSLQHTAYDSISWKTFLFFTFYIFFLIFFDIFSIWYHTIMYFLFIEQFSSLFENAIFWWKRDSRENWANVKNENVRKTIAN